MRFTVASTFAFAATALAMPQWGSWSGNQHWGPGACINDTTAQDIVTGYTYLLEHPGGPQFAQIANSILDPSNFTVQSDSINTLSQRPLGVPAFPSVQAFIGAGAQTPPLPVVTTLQVYHTCEQIFWRWNATGAAGMVNLKIPVVGMILFEVNATSKLVNTVYSEFNTAAFETDLGNPECQAQQ